MQQLSDILITDQDETSARSLGILNEKAQQYFKNQKIFRKGRKRI